MAHIHTSRQELLTKGVLLQDYLRCELQNGEGELRLINGRLYKLFEVYFAYRKQPLMEFLHQQNYSFYFHIFDLCYENEFFFAYSMEFYEDYPTLYEVLKSDCSLLDRKKLALQIVQMYEILLQNKILYSDWHSKNLLYKTDLKLLDIDSARLKSDSYSTKLSRKHLLLLVFSLLNAIDIDYDLENRGISKADWFDLLLKPKNEGYFPISLDFIKKEIERYTPSLVEYRKELILKKIKEKSAVKPLF